MYAEPIDLDRDELVRVLAKGWGLVVASMEYRPVGFGTHHYRVGDDGGEVWFVNVDDLPAKSGVYGAEADAWAELDGALTTAVALRAGGLEFVHAPFSRDWGVLARLGNRFAVSVYHFLDAISHPFGEFPSADLRRQVLAAVGRLHAVTEPAAMAGARRVTLDIPLRDALFTALDDLSGTWTSGPFAEPTRQLLAMRVDDIRAAFDRYDHLRRSVEDSGAPWVLTHGEPHAANVMQMRDGQIRLIDWDTVAIAPRERDLWQLEVETEADFAAYRSGSSPGTIAPPVNRDAIELYRLSWALSETSLYTADFRLPHVADDNTRVAFAGLGENVAACTGSLN